MNFLHNRSLLTLLSGLSLLTGPLSADAADPSTAAPSTEEDLSVEEHVPVRARYMNPEKREVMSRLRANEKNQDNQQEKEPSPLYRNAKLTANSDQSQFCLASCLVQGSYFTNCHWLIGVSDIGRTIEMEDASHWEIVGADQYTLSYWRKNDTLVITPNYDWFSSGDYFITNRNNNTYVRANLYVGPTAFGQYSHWIIAIDHVSGHVTLENGTVWCVYGSDSYLFREWEVNDHVILGLHDSWFNSFDHILINVNMDTHVRAKQY